MYRESRRTSKLSNARLALSKYDAKYSKASNVINDDTSDEADSELWKPDPIQKVPVDFHASLQADVTAILPIVQKGQGESSPTLPSRLEEAYSSDVNNVEQTGSVSLKTGITDYDEHESEQSSSSSAENQPSIKTASRASSIDSVKTDSAMGFNNVHSVSSLAESVLPFNELLEKSAKPIVELKVQRLSPKLSSPPSHSASDHSLNYTSEKFIKTTITTLPLATFPPPPILEFSKHTDPLESVEPVSSSVSAVKSLLSYPLKTEKNSSPGEQKYEDKKNNRPKLSKTISEIEQSAISSQNGLCKFCHKGEQKKVSVSVQTPKYFIDDRRRKHQSVSVQTRSTQESSPTAERISNVPIIKSTKLPNFSKAKFASTSVCNQLTDSVCRVEDQISQLVSHHVHLTEEFLKRQHKMYIANCKAVVLLEKGYQENNCS